MRPVYIKDNPVSSHCQSNRPSIVYFLRLLFQPPWDILLCLPHTWLSLIRMENEWIVTDSQLWIVPAKHGQCTRRLWMENLKTSFTVKLCLHYFNKQKKKPWGKKKPTCPLSHLIHLRFDSTTHQEASFCSLSICISTTHGIQASLWV